MMVGRFRKNDGYARDVVIMAAGTIVSQGITLLAMPVLSRLYLPEDFGMLAVFMAVSGIAATALTLRYETAILLPKEEEEAKALFKISVCLALVLGVLAFILSWIFPRKPGLMSVLSALGDWFGVAILCGMISSVIATGTAWYNRQRAYGRIAALRLLQSGSYSMGAILLGWLGIGYGILHAQWFSSLLAVAVVLFTLREVCSSGKNIGLWQVARNHAAAPKFLLPASLLDVITMQLPVLLIASWFGKDMAGQYSMAWRVLALPLALVGTAMGQVFLQRFAAAWPDAHAARSLLFRTWKSLFIIGAIPMALIMVYGEELFSLAFGAEWAESGKIARILAPMLFAMLISSPTSGILIVMNLQKYSLFFSISFIIYRTASLYFGVVYNNLFYGLMLLSAIEITVIFIYNTIAVKRIAGGI
jgi:O-antigen/teichoic acid export membrane protein